MSFWKILHVTFKVSAKRFLLHNHIYFNIIIKQQKIILYKNLLTSFLFLLTLAMFQTSEHMLYHSFENGSEINCLSDLSISLC